MKESQFFGFSVPVSAAAPKRACGAGGRVHSGRGRAAASSILPWPHRSSSGGPRGTPRHVQRGERACPAGGFASSTKGCLLPPLPGSLTAMSEADNVRGQKATHLKLCLERRMEV